MRSVESVSELQLIMGVLFSIALLCTNIVPVYATQDTLAVAKYVNGEWQLMYAESVYKSAFEATMNDGTTMSEVFVHLDTIGIRYLSARGHRNDSTYSFSFVLSEWTSSDGEVFLQVTVGGGGDDMHQCDVLDNVCLDCLPIGYQTPGGWWKYNCDCWEYGSGPRSGQPECKYKRVVVASSDFITNMLFYL